MEKDIINGEGTTDDGNRSRPRGWQARLVIAVLAAVGLVVGGRCVNTSDTHYAAQPVASSADIANTTPGIAGTDPAIDLE